MRKYLLLAGLASWLLASQTVWACEPCAEILSYEETVKQADVIVIGRKIIDGARSDPRKEYPGGPDWIMISVIKTLKGSVDEATIRVNSWDGMCEYGIVIDRRVYVLFLDKLPETWPRTSEDAPYNAVNSGCAVKSYLVKGETVQLEDRRLSVDDFVTELRQILSQQ